MYLLLHLAGALTAGIGLDYLKDKVFEWKKTYPYLLIGSMFPDIVDKTIGAFIFSTGRWIGHSLLFIFVISILGYLLIRNNMSEGARSIQMFFLGNIMHLFLDLPGISLTWLVIFWPIIDWNIPVGRTEAFLENGFSPFVIGTEIIGLIMILIFSNKMNFKRKEYCIILLGLIGYISLYLVLYALLI